MPRQERPLLSEDTPLLRFAGDLRRLRRRAGLPSYRELGKRASYSAAALSEAVSGRRLPSLGVTLAFVRACDGDVAQWTARWRDLAAAAPDADTGSPSPYVGLAAYQVEDADRFFGREALTDTLLRLVDERPFVGVFGASGVGKSSLLRAGLAARAERTPLVLTPGHDPVAELAGGLAQLLDEPVTRLRDELAAEPERLREWFARIPDDTLLVVDQFEEAFTLCAEAEQRWLVRALTTAAGPRTRVVVGVRADFYGHCGRYPDLVTALHRAQLLVGAMSPEELRRAITEPAARVGVSAETALVARLVADVAGQPAALPLLSHVLAEIWRRRRGVVLSLAGYQETGGVAHALARTAEQTFGALAQDDRDAARLLFLRLIAPGDGTEDTKRRVRRRELDTPAGLLDRLAAARLITVDRDGVELVHEALLCAWPRLAGWIAEDRDALRAHRGLAEATELWEAHGRDPDTLYRGARLEQVDRLTDRLNPREREFLDASRAAEQARSADRRRQTSRLRSLVAVLAILGVLLAGTAFAAVTAQRTAARERNQALSLRAADAASRLLESRPREAVALALAAYRVAPTAEARESLVLAQAAAGATTLGHGYLTPPGRIAVTYRSAEFGPGQRLWLRNGPGWRLAGAIGGAEQFYLLSADENTLVTWHTSTADNRMWDIADPGRPREIAIPAGLGMIDSVDRTGRLVSTLGTDRKAVVWRVADGSTRRLPATDVEGTALLPDGTGVILARRVGDEHTAELWSLDGNLTSTLLRSPHAMYPYAGPSGRVVLVGTESGEVTLLDATDPHSPRTVATVSGASHPAVAVFEPHGRAAAVVNADVIRMWDAGTGATRLALSVKGLGLGSPRIVDDGGALLVLKQIDGTLWRLDSDLTRVIRDSCAGPLTVDWDRYFPGVPETPLCP